MLRLTLMKVAGGPVFNPRILAVVPAKVVYYLPVVYCLQRVRVTSGASRGLGLDGGKRNFGWTNGVKSIGRRPCPQFQPPLVQGQCSSGGPGCDEKMQMPTVEENQDLEGKLFETLWMTGCHQRSASRPSKKERRQYLRKCLKSVLGSGSNVDMGAPKVVFHEQREISKRPERQRMATLGTVAACSQTSRPADQIPAQGGGERYSLCVAHRMRMANAPSRPASVAHHIPLLPHMASRWDHGADS